MGAALVCFWIQEEEPMACACKRGPKSNVTYKVTLPDGSVKAYRSATEAKVIVARKGGTWEEIAG